NGGMRARVPLALLSDEGASSSARSTLWCSPLRVELGARSARSGLARAARAYQPQPALEGAHGSSQPARLCVARRAAARAAAAGAARSRGSVQALLPRIGPQASSEAPLVFGLRAVSGGPSERTARLRRRRR